jgi:hypothetical protein
LLTHLIGCLALLAQDAPEPDVAALVAGLGAPRFADRQAADAALRKLGAPALPALRGARLADDPEVAARASALVRGIETAVLLQPTRVALDFRDRPLAEVVAELRRRSGFDLALDPAAESRLGRRRVTLEADGPATLWEALTRLEREAGLGVLVGDDAAADDPDRGPRGLVLFERLADRPAPGFASGPFRVKVLGTHYERSRAFERRPADLGGAEDFERATLLVQVSAEPRLLIAARGPIRLTEAVDDLGQSLLPPAPPAAAGFDELGLDGQGDLGAGQGPSFVEELEVRRPERPGRAIRRLRGSVELSVASRRAEPVGVPLGGAPGRVARGEDATITVHALATDRESEELTLDLTVGPPAGGGDGPGARSGLSGPAFAWEFLEQQIEVLDGRGRPFVLFPMSLEPQGDAFRLKLLLAPTEGAGEPAELRYYGLVRAECRLDFDVRDLEMP